ncbi:putative fluoride ion transporter CrcB [Sphingomonas sp. DBB INV C78]|uniref:fluoride efflux transporter FluC n=1 Tax=Sphingomonas sp. DBB INV C78 TaxID=3349434 RepID=UPI0036D264CD
MPPLLLVMLGGAIGAGLRYQVTHIAYQIMGPGFPWGTWIINLVGGLLMGILVGALSVGDPGATAPLRLMLGAGVLGGFTTFSAFSLETVGMLQSGGHVMAAAYAVSSVAGSVVLCIIGLFIGRALA